MKGTLLVPQEGLMEWFTYDVDPVEELRKRGVEKLVQVGMHFDDVSAGVVLFSIDDALPVNQRATDVTGMVSGSFVQVRGLAAFYGLEEETVVRIMLEVN